MSQPNTIQVTLEATDSAPTSTIATLFVWTKARAVAKAWKMAGLVLAAAALMIPIPIVHFFAIPVVFIGAPVVWFGVYKLHVDGTDIEGDGICPKCQAPLPLKGSADRWPLSKTCQSCRSTVSVSKG